MVHLQGNKLSHETMKQIQELLIRNRKQFEEERISEANERRYLHREITGLDKIAVRIKDKQREVDATQDKVLENQFSRERLFVEEHDYQEEEDRRLMKRLEKEAAVRLVRKKRRPAKK